MRISFAKFQEKYPKAYTALFAVKILREGGEPNPRYMSKGANSHYFIVWEEPSDGSVSFTIVSKFRSCRASDHYVFRYTEDIGWDDQNMDPVRDDDGNRIPGVVFSDLGIDFAPYSLYIEI